MARLISYATDQEIPVGGQAEADHNHPVTVTGVIPPFEEGDFGSVEIRWSWGEAATIDPARLNAYIGE